MKYNALTQPLLDELRNLLGAKNVLCDEEQMATYSHDETAEDEYGHMPEVVVTPTSTRQVAEVVKLANREGIPITPRGAGSGLSGGCIPVFGGIVLSLEKMNRILEVDADNMLVVAEAGIVTNEINDALKDRGLWFAGYPMSLETCFLGGNIAENAGGGKAVKYGVTGRYVYGIELVTPTGDVVELGGKLAKDVTGYDLKQLVVGSEGTLGIVTKATIKLTALPTKSCALLVLYKTPKQAIEAVKMIMTSGFVPSSAEFMDAVSVKASCEYLNESLPYQDCGAMLLLEVDGGSDEQVESDAETMGDLCMSNGAIEVYVADNATTRERVWSVRRNIAEAFKVQSPAQSLEDIVVPIAVIPDIIPELETIAERYDITIPCYGHAGDGNLHATLVKNPEHTMEEWHAIEPKALNDLYEATHRLHGKISGEHGIGLKRKEYMRQFVSPVELDLCKAIKTAWDPNGIMNPGKIFDLPNEE